MDQRQQDYVRKFIEILAASKPQSQNLLQESLYLLLELVQAKHGFLAFMQDSGRSYSIAAASRPEQIGVQKNVAPRTIIDHISRTKEPILITNLAQDQRIHAPQPQKMDYSLLCLPILDQAGDLIGILNASGSIKGPKLQEYQQQAAQNFLNFITPFLERIQDESSQGSQAEPELDVLGEVLGAAPESCDSDYASLLDFPQQAQKSTQAGQLHSMLYAAEFAQTRNSSCSGPKKKSTYYLTPELFELLDQAKDQSKGMARKEQKSRITKTSIVNFALGIVLKDFQAHKQDSLLIRKLLADQD
ncbi:MAG: GAF domain-containing protein [Desulfohalobiaceae bacterium]